MRNLNCYNMKSKSALKAIVFVVAASVLQTHAAYSVPKEYECKTGYYNVITEPADISPNYTGAVTLRKLPPNVCVRRLDDLNPDATENFTKSDFIKIVGAGLEPFPGVTYNKALYEPIIGHYMGPTITEGNFTGSHPVLIHKNAGAAIRLENKVYYIDKQSKIDGEEKGVCPTGYSTVGSSAACYSQTNGLKLYRYNKLGLIAMSEHFKPEDFPPAPRNQDTPRSPDEKCPLGYTMNESLGSHGGICMPVQVVLQHSYWVMQAGSGQSKLTVVDYGINLPDPGDCPALQASPQRSGVSSDSSNSIYLSRCMPLLVAITCEMDEASKVKFHKINYPSKWAIILLDTLSADLAAELPTQLYSNRMKMTRSEIKVSKIINMLSLFIDDDWFVAPSRATTSGSVPIWAMHSGLSCADLWKDKPIKGGYSLEPFPSAW